MKNILITDLDDTLYNWTEYFIISFYAMVDKLSEIIKVDENMLLEEYKSLHQKYGNVEQPYVTLELPSVKAFFKNYDKEQIHKALDEVFHVFNSTRIKTLKLYDGVQETLEYLYNNGIIIIGYTESPEENGYYRLKKLGIDKYFTELYVLDSDFSSQYRQMSTKVKIHKVPRLSKKPNPDLLNNICNDHSIKKTEAIYLGDSITKDMYMAFCAGITSVWAKYGVVSNPEFYRKLVKISHWTESDFTKEKALKETCKDIKPDYTISNINELKSIIF